MDTNKCKVTICGDSCVGKTCLINRIAHGFFNENTNATMISSNVSKPITLTDGGEIDFDITDTPGQEKFRSLNRLYYNTADIVLILFDLTNKKSFYEVKHYWYNSVKDNAKKDQSIIIFNYLFSIGNCRNKM